MANKTYSEVIAKWHQHFFGDQVEPRPGQEEAAAYPRVSDPKQEANSSIPMQIELMLREASQRGWFVRRENILPDVHTADDLFQRPQMMQVCALVEKQLVKHVFVYVWDRISRHQEHAAWLEVHFGRYGVELHYLSEDESLPMTERRVIRALKSYVAECELLNIRRRATGASLERVKAGKPANSTRPPLGLQYVKVPYGDKLDTIGFERAPEWELVRRMYDDILYHGSSLNRLAATLQEEGVPTPKGAPKWHRSTLRAILGNPIYYGQPVGLRYQPVKENGKQSVRVRPADEQFQLSPLPAGQEIVTYDEWMQTQRILADNRTRSARNSHWPEQFLLRGGFAICGECGAVMLTHATQGKFAYECRNREHHANGKCVTTPAATLDSQVWDGACAIFRDPEIISHMLATVRTDGSLQERLVSIDATLKEYDRESKRNNYLIGKVTQDYQDEDGDITDLDALEYATASYRVRQKEIATLVTRLRGDRAALERECEAQRVTATQLDRLATWCGGIDRALPTLTFAQKQAILAAFGLRAYCWHYQHEPQRYEIRCAIDVQRLLDQATERDCVQNGSPFCTQNTSVINLRWSPDTLTFTSS